MPPSTPRPPLRAVAIAVALAVCTAAAAFRRATPARPVQYAELQAAPASPADHRIAYGEDAALQYCELRLPSARAGTPAPVAVIVHGGCWRSDYDLGYLRGLATALTRAGVAT